MNRLPDFIVAGVRKCGSTWLHQCLGEHPEIFVPPMTKEIFFFDRHWQRGTEWYARFFANAGAGQICGEATPSYFAHPLTAERIKRAVPNVKLIFVFRNPVERAISMYHHMASVGEVDVPFAEALERRPELLEEGYYDRHFGRFQNLFGNANLFPLILEEARANGENALEPLFRFLGVDPSFQPPSLFERSYARREARSSHLAALAGRMSLFFRDSGLHAVVNAAKSANLHYLFYKTKPSPPAAIPPFIVEQLKANYIDDTGRFGARIGRDLIGLWGLKASD